MTSTPSHKQQLLAYFDGLGFERWQAIYGDAQLSGVRQTIREGHAAMLAHAVEWLAQAAGDGRVLDAGCGTGLLTLALARRDLHVMATDLAPQMARATEQAARAAGLADLVEVRAGDLEQASGSYAAVACLDVLIHYPAHDVGRMVGQLAGLTEGPLVLTYAPHEPLLAALHWLGGRFPRSQRRTDIQMIREQHMAAMLAANQRVVRRMVRVSRGFYHVTLIEAVRQG